MKSIQFDKFILKYAPSATVEKADSNFLAKYQNLVPTQLIEIWEHYGFGFYGNGFLQLINPDVYHEVLCGWLLRKPDPTRIPFMINAFGTIIYYRLLQRDELSSQIIAEDVAFLEPNYRFSDVFSWSLESFFEDFLCDEDNLQQMFYYENFDLAIQKYGPLLKNNMYCFKLALPLGGNDSVDQMMQGNAAVQLNLLLQLC